MRPSRGLACSFSFAAILLAVGCSGSGSSSSGPDCAGASHRLESCGAGSFDACKSVFRSDFAQGFVDCVLDTTSACDAKLDDTCAGRAAAGLSSRAIDSQYRDACAKKRNDCAASGTSFPDDDCLQSVAFVESAVSAAQDCLAKPCPDVAACLQLAFGI